MYHHLFFDLDHTLWDFERNARETLTDLFGQYSLADKGIPGPETFIDTYRHINRALWEAYRSGRITPETLRYKRFEQTLQHFHIHDRTLAPQMADDYIRICPTKPHMLPHAMATLEALSRQFPLYIITNGFETTQHRKLERTGLCRFFRGVVTSERAGGYKKPHSHIFSFALQQAGATAAHSLYIGDSWEADILGAARAGIDQVFFNPGRHAPALHPESFDTPEDIPTREVGCLSEIPEWLRKADL